MIESFQDTLYIKRYLNGDIKAFDKLLDRYKNQLFSFILKMVKNHEIAEDIFQETFIKVVKNLQNYKENGTFSSWLFSIAHNSCRDHWRKENNYKDTQDINDTRESDFEFKDDDFNILDQISTDEDINWLRKTVQDLPEKLKEVLLLHVYEDMAFREIAEKVGCSINTVLGRMHYAKQRLKESWSDYEKER